MRTRKTLAVGAILVIAVLAVGTTALADPIDDLIAQLEGLPERLPSAPDGEPTDGLPELPGPPSGPSDPSAPSGDPSGPSDPAAPSAPTSQPDELQAHFEDQVAQQSRLFAECVADLQAGSLEHCLNP